VSSGTSSYPNAEEGSPAAFGLSPGAEITKHESGWERQLGERLRIPLCTSKEDVDALLNATDFPPLTKESLEELDLRWIQKNIKLRVDINYDHDLHFVPVAGERGEHKRRKAKKYWSSLVAELRIVYQHNVLVSCAECDEFRSSGSRSRRPVYFHPRLPQMFLKLKELLTILVPESDQAQIVEYLDISLLLQELSHGLLDVKRLAQWLCVLLTSHCAPIRDKCAEEMAEQIRTGAERGDLQALVAGIEKLFAFLEAMKLDVVNHQIRNLRYLLIDDTVNFQQEYFGARIGDGKIHVRASREWYDDAVARHGGCRLPGETTKPVPMASLIHGLVRLCQSTDLDLPESLKHDESRLCAIRDEIQDIIHLNLCLCLFDQLVNQLQTLDSDPPLAPRLVGNGFAEARLSLQERMMDLTQWNSELDLTISEIWLSYIPTLALELVRAAFDARGRAASSISSDDVTNISKRLAREFEREREHGLAVARVVRILEHATHRHARVFQNMTTLAISEAQKQWSQKQPPRRQWPSMLKLAHMARSLAHMAVINWRVWADLVYLEDADDLSGAEDSDGMYK
jgi:hypothetical protein